MEFSQFIVSRIREESEDVRSFVLAPSDGSLPPRYQPGNFFLLMLPDGGGKKVFRSYSAASHPDEKELLFCVKRKGNFPAHLFALNVGDKLDVSGPYGTFVLRAEDTARAFIAGGTGITPIRSMLLQTLKEGKPCALFHSAKNAAELTFGSEMRELAAKNPQFRYFPAITRDAPPAGWEGIAGRLNAEVIAGRLGSLLGNTFYLCGSKEMAGAISADLIAHGVEKANVKKEEWG